MSSIPNRKRSTGRFADATVRLVGQLVELPPIAGFFITQTASTPWGGSLSRLSRRRRWELAVEMTRRLADSVGPDATVRMPFACRQLEASRV